MIEFISLCVCSACLSCLCCLITGGLCVTRAAGRLRNKIVENHLPDRMQWLGSIPPYQIDSESDNDSIASDVRQVPIVRSKANGSIRSNTSKESEKISRKNGALKSRDDESRKPKRWTFCFRVGKSSEYSAPVESKDAETPERKSRRCKMRKKFRSPIRKNYGSKTHYAYFKSCSCTNVVETGDKKVTKNRRKPEKSATRQRGTPASKDSRKSRKCPKNCNCKTIVETNKRQENKKCCECGAKK